VMKSMVNNRTQSSFYILSYQPFRKNFLAIPSIVGIYPDVLDTHC
jgi:hypothetical protein